MVASSGRRAGQGAALAPGRRLHRDQVVEALWPDRAARCRGAAAAQGRALRPTRAAAPRPVPWCCATTWCAAAGRRRRGRGRGRARSCRAAARWPTARCGARRQPARRVRRATAARRPLRAVERASPRDGCGCCTWTCCGSPAAGRSCCDEEPADEQAHLALIRASVDQGDVRGGAPPVRAAGAGDAARARHRPEPGGRRAPRLARGSVQDGARVPARERRRLFGRRAVGDELRRRLDEAEAGRGGMPGAQRTGRASASRRCSRWPRARARARGWRTGRGDAAAVEGPWPYAPVLEALSELCRKHPALLDGLADEYRSEIERALAGRDVTWTGGSGHQRLFVAAAELIRLAAAGHGVMLVVDDLHEADEASMRLLHYLARCAAREPVLVVVAHRPLVGTVAAAGRGQPGRPGHGQPHRAGAAVRERRRGGCWRSGSRTCPGRTSSASWRSAAGSPSGPRARAPACRTAQRPCCRPCPPAVLRTFERVALLGARSPPTSCSPCPARARRRPTGSSTTALSALVVEPAEPGYRFRHALVREALLGAMPPRSSARTGAAWPRRSPRWRRHPAGSPTTSSPAGSRHARCRTSLRAVETAGALGAYRDALALIDAVRPHAGPERPAAAAGPARRPAAWRSATRRRSRRTGGGPAHHRHRAPAGARPARPRRRVRRRLRHRARRPGRPGPRGRRRGRARSCWRAGTSRTSPATSTPPGRSVDEARELLQVTGRPVAGRRPGRAAGPDRAPARRVVRAVPRSSCGAPSGKQRLATAVFDAHLCVAEYLLYGPVPYAEVIARGGGAAPTRRPGRARCGGSRSRPR